MSKDIKDFLHYYLGQQVLINNGIYENKVDFLTHINDVGDCAGKEYEWLAKDCQLILRKIEDMTEEEMIFVCHMHMPNGWRGLRLLEDNNTDWGMRISDIDGNGKSLYVRKDRLTPNLFHYLLSKGFDLFSLIDSGAALDAKNLQQ